MRIFKPLLLLISLGALSFVARAGEKDSIAYYTLPDSVKVIAFIADIRIDAVGAKENFAGITASGIRLLLEADKKEKEVAFEYPKNATLVTAGLHTEKEKHAVEWTYHWQEHTTYKLLIASAGDSAQNYALYSGYIFLPESKQWKLIGTVRMDGSWMDNIRQPGVVYSTGKNSAVSATLNNAWAQRNNNRWKILSDEKPTAPPLITPMPNVDSVEQFRLDKQIIEGAIASGKTGAMHDTAGVYYAIVQQGNGKPIALTDSIEVRYRLTLFPSGTPVEDTYGRNEAPSFRLNRLIKGWQLAIPKINAGGKVRIVIPSGMAYSIRTRSAHIPPNSILEFEVEVIDVKS